MKSYNLHSKFDIDDHKRHFNDFIDLIVLPDGSAKYAIPDPISSMQKHLLQTTGMSESELLELSPCNPESYFNWLLNRTECVVVYKDKIRYKYMTIKQEEFVNNLRRLNMISFKW